MYWIPEMDSVCSKYAKSSILNPEGQCGLVNRWCEVLPEELKRLLTLPNAPVSGRLITSIKKKKQINNSPTRKAALEDTEELFILLLPQRGSLLKHKAEDRGRCCFIYVCVCIHYTYYICYISNIYK